MQEILGPVVAGLDGTSVDLAEALPLAVVAVGTLQDQIVRAWYLQRYLPTPWAARPMCRSVLSLSLLSYACVCVCI